MESNNKLYDKLTEKEKDEHFDKFGDRYRFMFISWGRTLWNLFIGIIVMLNFIMLVNILKDELFIGGMIDIFCNLFTIFISFLIVAFIFDLVILFVNEYQERKWFNSKFKVIRK